MAQAIDGMFLEVSTELLKLGYGVRFRPVGHSMHPTIRDGEAVTIEPVSAEIVRRGDILLYGAGRGLTAHRVRAIERKEGGQVLFHLRGDANTERDAPVEAGQILGRVVAVERDGRKINLVGRRAALRYALRVAASRVKSFARAGAAAIAAARSRSL